jgi:hypothetical protein
MLFIFPYAKLEKTNDFNPSHITALVTRIYERGGSFDTSVWDPERREGGP